jgi:hypothetical protein
MHLNLGGTLRRSLTTFIRATLAHTKKPVGTIFFRRVYRFGPKVARNRAELEAWPVNLVRGPEKHEGRPVLMHAAKGSRVPKPYSPPPLRRERARPTASNFFGDFALSATSRPPSLSNGAHDGPVKDWIRRLAQWKIGLRPNFMTGLQEATGMRRHTKPSRV